VRHNIAREKLSVPGKKIQRGEISDLATDPVALSEITLKLAPSLRQHVETDINAEHGKIPEISPFLEVHDALRTVKESVRGVSTRLAAD
jgi:hypothetical protein